MRLWLVCHPSVAATGKARASDGAANADAMERRISHFVLFVTLFEISASGLNLYIIFIQCEKINIQGGPKHRYTLV